MEIALTHAGIYIINTINIISGSRSPRGLGLPDLWRWDREVVPKCWYTITIKSQKSADLKYSEVILQL